MVELTDHEKMLLRILVKNEIITVESDEKSKARDEIISDLTALVEKLK